LILSHRLETVVDERSFTENQAGKSPLGAIIIINQAGMVGIAYLIWLKVPNNNVALGFSKKGVRRSGSELLVFREPVLS
jgi:hypothetical protein